MLGAFLKATGLVDEELMYRSIDEAFGSRNVEAAKEAYDSVVVIPKESR